MKYQKLINQLLRGYNGIDSLFYVNLILIIVCIVLNIFINNFFLSLIQLLLIILIVFRIFSKNISARQKENRLFENIIRTPKKKIKLYWNIIKNYNHALYKKCPYCKQMIKLPLKKGKHDVICPTCKKKFTVKCNRNEKLKVEVVNDRV